MFGVRGNTQTHTSLSFVSGMRVRTLRLYFVGQSTQNPLPVLCIFRIPGRIMYLIKCTVTCPDPTTDMFSVLGSHLHFPLLKRGTRLHEFLKRLPVSEYTELDIHGQ